MNKIYLFLIGTIIFYNCAGVKPQPDWTASQYFKYAMDIYEDEDYYESINEFTVIVLRYPGSSVADSAQFYLAESHYFMDEFIIAAAEYEKLILNMGRSPLMPMAQFKLADCYYQMSPRPELDQEYTHKALRECQYFIEENPTHEMREEAEKKMYELRSKLAEKKWTSGEIYRKMRKFRAAIVYFDIVLDKYYDTEWADRAMYGKIQTYLEMDNNTAARLECYKLLEQFPKSEFRDKVEYVLEFLPEDEESDANG